MAGFCQSVNPFAAMPNCVLGIVQVRLRNICRQIVLSAAETHPKMRNRTRGWEPAMPTAL